jgi:hypothetical protein
MAVKSHGWALKYVPMHLRTKRICFLAVKKDPNAFRFVPPALQAEIERMVDMTTAAKKEC